MPFDWAVFLSGVLAATATAGSVFYAAKQIKSAADDQRRNELWRRADSARVMMQRLTLDEELAFCARALDWGVGPLLIPAKYLALFPNDIKFMEHQPELMASAVSVNLCDKWRTPEALTYRYTFDYFMSYLDDLRAYAERNLIYREDFVGIDYYLELLRTPPYIQDKDVFLRFIKRFYPQLVSFVRNETPHAAS